MLKLIAGAVAAGVTLFSGCRSKVKTDSETAFVTGSWWADSGSNLLVAVSRNPRVSYCIESSGASDPAAFAKDSEKISAAVRSALSDWFRAIKESVDVKQSSDACRADLGNGFFKIVLHYDEGAFQRNISQTSSPTLGVYLVGNASLHLNMNGILNPLRDPTGGKKTILHELGHMFGLHHSTVRGAVMQANLGAASNELTADDIAGIAAVWQRLRASGRPNPSVRETSAVRPADVENPAAAPVAVQDSLTFTMRYDSWFKISTEQSAQLQDSQKCALQQGRRIRAKALNGGKTEAAHLKIQLDEDLSGCAIGRAGSVGWLYKPHVD
jgi:hypothetical protein